MMDRKFLLTRKYVIAFMPSIKKKSKRMTTKRRVKIEKKVKEHNKKKRREARKNPKKGKRKDPGIPNSLPFKETVLKELEDRKRRVEEERQKQKERRAKDREKLQNKKRNLADIVKNADKRQLEYERKQAAKANGGERNSRDVPERSLKTYFKEFKKVVDAADVVLEILDSRDPLGSRCHELETSVLTSDTNKKLVLVLNKIDLVPRENVEAWLKYLRNEFPTVAFKASTQAQSDHLSQKKMQAVSKVSDDLMKSSHCLGADVLMKLLGNYCRNQDIRTSIRVGVVGFPNTGKSSLINSLKRSKACNVGAVPGVTKTMQEVHLDKHIKLLDSPGVVMASNQSPTAAVLRNVVKLEALDDPVPAVDTILKRCSKDQLMLHYTLPDFKTTDEFLALMAKRHGQLKKGGVPDVGRAARGVLKDWTSGKISFYTHPPEKPQEEVQATIVSEMSKAFDIDSLITAESQLLGKLDSKRTKHMLMADVTVALQPKAKGKKGSSQPESTSTGRSIFSAKTKRAETSQPSGSGVTTENTQTNKDRKKAFRKMKKDRKKSDVVAGKLSNALETAFNIGLGDDESGDNYDFATDFT
ncbi:hypothetical protein BaRGS_00039131 [Batillaria attramentaria]|uniref:CP-type G domain-containing protein n=1 Tax=Batillaria attramentaria TaxID=370345 RepID=A0ABD0J4I4_9CAEN